MTVPGRLFQPDKIFVGIVRAHERYFSRVGLLENIILDWKNLPGTNTLAYFEENKLLCYKLFSFVNFIVAE